MKIAALPLLFVGISLSLLRSSCRAQELPDQVIVGYWHNWAWPNGLTLDQLPEEFNVVNISFAVPAIQLGADMVFTPDPNIYPNPADFLADVQALQASGRKVLISIGGGADPVHVENAIDQAVFVASMLNIMNTWGFDGIDIDLEGSSLSLNGGDTDLFNPTTPRIVNFIQAMQTLLAQLPADTILTAAPETAFVQGGASAYVGVWGAYLPVLEALRNDFDYVHVQHYNSGSMFGRDGLIYSPSTADFHVAMADCLLAGFTISGGQYFAPLRSDQVAIGLPASTSAAGSGYTPPATVLQALDYLYLGESFQGSYVLANSSGYPDFRGVMTWSVNWDMLNNNEFSSAYRSYFDELFLEASTSTLSASVGGNLDLALKGGLGNANRNYVLVGSGSGTTPGMPLPGGLVTLPLNRDSLTTRSFRQAGSAVFANFQGALDSSGRANAQFNMPPISSSLVGTELHFAFGLSSPWDFVSQPVMATITL